MEKTNKGFIKPYHDVEVLNQQDLTKSVRIDKSPIPHFKKEELNILLAAIKKPTHQMLMQFLWRTGVRVTESISIQKSDLDFDNKEITIRWLKKRKALYRIIPMHKSLVYPLSVFVDKLKHDNLVFAISRQRVDQLCKKYNLNHAHKIRHSFSINFLRQSTTPMALLVLKELLGHSRIETTMIYLKVVPMNMKVAMENINFD